MQSYEIRLEAAQSREQVTPHVAPVATAAVRLLRSLAISAGRVGVGAVSLMLMGAGVLMWVTTPIVFRAIDSSVEALGGRVPWGAPALRAIYGFGFFAPTVLMWMAGARLWELSARFRD